MLKKIGYFYLIIMAIAMLLFLLAGALGTETDYGFLAEAAGWVLFLFLLYTSPLWLLVLVLLIAGGPLRQLLARAERFHAGGR